MTTRDAENGCVPADVLERFGQALMKADRVAVRQLFSKVPAGAEPFAIVEQLIVPALDRIGSDWAEGRAALSQVYMSGRICEELVDELLPPHDPSRKVQPPMAIAALQDRHLLGKRLVYSVLRSAGYALNDYGTASVDDLVASIRRDRIEVVLISTLMLASALQVAELRKALNREGLHPTIVVGGAPFQFDPQLWREVGADAMGRTASEILPIVARLEKECSQ